MFNLVQPEFIRKHYEQMCRPYQTFKQMVKCSQNLRKFHLKVAYSK